MIALFVLFLLLIIVALVGIFATTGALDVTVDDAYYSILCKTFPNHFESKYIFTWDDVPGSDSERLRNYLWAEYGIDWAEDAKISKSDDCRTITIADGENSARITLDRMDSGKAWLRIEGGRSENLEVKGTNGEMRMHESTWLADVCIWNLRIPRILLAILTGFCLGTAGAIMQWALKNPLASPYTLGISSVVACGAPIAIIIGGASIEGEAFMILGVAGIFALIATAIILYISRRRWATPERVVLMGIVMMILSVAITTILMYFGKAEAVMRTVF
ncbi:MAG: iron ABC transporter permease [ANME-2 cluster archaeon]|nr:iron ABC transporter permease [ANME-2 cluster archaeon]